YFRPGTYAGQRAQAGDFLQDRRAHDRKGPAAQKDEAQRLQERRLVGGALRTAAQHQRDN
ncbi:MAG: hypothetical protein IKH72_06415, partial [Firmicutes bacterium]|nr:hypothetical protein [Bacillota bacterium]